MVLRPTDPSKSLSLSTKYSSRLGPDQQKSSTPIQNVVEAPKNAVPFYKSFQDRPPQTLSPLALVKIKALILKITGLRRNSSLEA